MQEQLAHGPYLQSRFQELANTVNNKLNENEKEEGDDVEVRTYQNGNTPEPVYADTDLKNRIGTLNPHEKCDCLGVFGNRAIVRYKVDGVSNYKIGFAKWLGGVK